MYLKLPAGEGKFTVIPLTDKNVYSICPICGEEHKIDLDDLDELITIPGFEFSRRVCCWPCTVAINKEGLDALMERQKESLSYELEQQTGKQPEKG